MNPITHFLAGWVVLERTQTSLRDLGLVALAGVAPDLDGLGIVVDFVTRNVGGTPTDLYQTWHRVIGHGLPAALVIAAAAACAAGNRVRVAIGAFVAVHLHFLCDVLGSRGAGPEDIWGISYFAPFDTPLDWSWSGQWPLIGWQNTTITAALLAATFVLAVRRGTSPLALVSTRADAVVVATLRRRFGAALNRPSDR